MSLDHVVLTDFCDWATLPDQLPLLLEVDPFHTLLASVALFLLDLLPLCLVPQGCLLCTAYFPGGDVCV